jgi:hypothetical protein
VKRKVKIFKIKGGSSWSNEAPNFVEFSAGQMGAGDIKRQY